MSQHLLLTPTPGGCQGQTSLMPTWAGHPIPATKMVPRPPRTENALPARPQAHLLCSGTWGVEGVWLTVLLQVLTRAQGCGRVALGLNPGVRGWWGPAWPGLLLEGALGSAGETMESVAPTMDHCSCSSFRAGLAGQMIPAPTAAGPLLQGLGFSSVSTAGAQGWTRRGARASAGSELSGPGAPLGWGAGVPHAVPCLPPSTSGHRHAGFPCHTVRLSYGPLPTGKGPGRGAPFTSVRPACLGASQGGPGSPSLCLGLEESGFLLKTEMMPFPALEGEPRNWG